MSDPNPGVTVRKGNGSKYLFLFLLGLVVGAVAVVMALRAWDARKDHFPESLMHVQGWHMAQLGKAVEQNRCAATDTLPHFKALRTTADDLERAFPDLADDKRFSDAASKLRGTLDGTLASPPMNCEGVAALNKDIGAACKACHQDFR
jgi:cytochrome c556